MTFAATTTALTFTPAELAALDAHRARMGADVDLDTCT